MTKLRVGLFVVVAAAVLYGGAQYSQKMTREAKEAVEAQAAATRKAADEEMAKVGRRDVVVGTGPEAVEGSLVALNYVGTLVDGKEFDSNLKSGQPFSFRIGSGKTIRGFELGVIGMKVGGKRVITVPPELGYGDRAVASIPASSTLTFSLELLEVK